MTWLNQRQEDVSIMPSAQRAPAWWKKPFPVLPETDSDSGNTQAKLVTKTGCGNRLAREVARPVDNLSENSDNTRGSICIATSGS